MAKINILVGENIRRYRSRNKLTQAELALKTGLHRAYIAQIERGRKNIGLLNLQKIARGLNVGMDKLLKEHK